MSIADIKWSENQRKIIMSNDKRILVSASAGSGKTTVMIARILRLILEGHKLSNMLICTFTRAAAADMRSKLYKELVDFYHNGKCDKAKAELVKNALKELSAADISTIDSFCQHLVGKYFYLIGVDPQFEVVAGDSYIMQKRAIENAVSEMSGEAFDKLRTILRAKHSDAALSDAIMSIMEYDSINLSPVSNRYDGDEIKRATDELTEGERQKIMRSIDLLFKGDDFGKRKELCEYLATGKKNFTPLVKGCPVNTGIEYLKDRIEKFYKLKATVSELKPQSQSEQLIQALLDAAALSKRLYSEEKQRKNQVDFADLERYALDILLSGEKEVRSKYKYVFVDEYQDINPLQERLITELSLDADLFMVGDLKQSIYAFRGCEPRFFKEKYESFTVGSGGTAFDLDVNYRSGKAIISFVNEVFVPVMKREFGGTDYAKNPMVACSDKEGSATLHVIKGSIKSEELHGVYSVKDHDMSKMSKNKAECIEVARRVKELVEKGADFCDIAILSRKLTAPVFQLAELLLDMGVPVSIGESAYFLQRPETGQLIAFLQLIDSHMDDRALAVSMLSPLGGFNENELGKIRLGRSGSFYECALKAASSDEKVRAFFDKLDRYTALSQKVGADELCAAIVSECGYFNYAFSLGEAAAEVLDKFLEYLGGVPVKSSLYATLRYIEEHNPFVELSGEANAVRIMTVHKSKGLEFKHVLAVGLNSFNDVDLHMSICASDHLIMNVFDARAEYLSDAMLLYRMRQKQKRFEEELRILYVALTRAKESLDVFVTLPGKDNMIDAYADCGPDIIDFASVTAPSRWLVAALPNAVYRDIAQIEVEKAEPRNVLIAKADEELAAELKNYFDFAAPPAAPAKSYVSKLAHSDDEPAVVMFTEDHLEGDARERGNAYHRALENIDFASPDLAAVSNGDLKLIDTDKLLDAARNMSGLKGSVYKEKPFMLRLEAKQLGYDGGFVLVQGVIDLLVIDGDEATIVDYKTGAMHGSYEKGYFKQVNLYATAVERLLGKKVKAKYLYYIDERAFVEVS